MRVWDEQTNDGQTLPLPIVGEKHLDSEVEKVPAALIRAEANLLRLPLFALHTKGLKSLDGIECKGRVTRDGRTHEFTFRATRNTATLYPGPLARSAHLAFLSIITEHGLPLRGPLSWTWRDLCRRMQAVYGGQMVRHLKDAISSTAGLLLHSEYALYSKPDGQLLHTRQDALHLYERVAFVGTPLPDGGTADANYLWLSQWYLDNLNAMFTAPLDYVLWRYLDQRSPIASRLYEFLLLNFHSGTPVLRINYETLVQFLPVRAERYRSEAQRQLAGALEQLRLAGIVHAVEWTDSKNGLAQLHFYRGKRLSTAGAAGLPAPSGEEFGEAVEVRELRNLKPPEWGLVAEFFRLWSGEQQRRPSPKELAQAHELVEQHGLTKAKALLPLIVKRMKIEWPDAKTFGAVALYVPDALRDHDRAQHRLQQEKQDRLREQQERAEQARRQAEFAKFSAVWPTLSEGERRAIEQDVHGKYPRLAHNPDLLERYCIRELARRLQGPKAAA